MIAIRLERRLPLGLVLGGLAAALACGGSQENGGGAAGDCQRIRSGISASDLESAAACYREVGDASAADQCRNAADLGAIATPAALRDLAGCVLQVGDRGDGVWLADMMYAVGDDADKLAALGDAFAGPFDTAVHGVTWTSSLEEETQHALGRALDRLTPSARDELVSLVLAYRVVPLATYCAAYTGDIDPTDPGLVVFAEQLAASGDPIDENGRRILLATGTWSAQDTIECYRGDRSGCDSWEGESPLELLAELDPSSIEIGLASTPATALQTLRSPDVDAASARGLAALIGGADYPNRGALMASMMLDLTDSSFRRDIRLAIANAATEPMCHYDTLRDYFLRAPTSDPDRFENADAPWPTFIRNCAERHWTADDLMAGLAAGSWLGVPRDTYDALYETLEERVGSASCDEYRAMGQMAYSRTAWVITRATAQVIAARLGGSECASLLEPAVREVYDDRDEHPEARLAAMLLLAEVDRSSTCSSSSRVRSILDWVHPDYGDGPGVWAEQLGRAVNTACAR